MLDVHGQRVGRIIDPEAPASTFDRFDEVGGLLCTRVCSYDYARVLLEKGQDIHATGTECKSTPLHFAALSRRGMRLDSRVRRFLGSF